MQGQQIFTSARENKGYAYAVGRLRVLETRLLDNSDILRLLESETAQEILRALAEGDYERALSNVSDVTDFETALSIERERIYSLIDELSLDPDLTNIFRIRWDFHNLKVLLKSRYLEASGSTASVHDRTLVESGSIPVDDLRSVVNPDEEGNQGEAPEYITKALESAENQYEETQNPQMIDIIIDYHLQDFLYNFVASYPNPFLSGYFQSVADLINIKNFVRLKMLDESLRMLDLALLPHGILDREIFLKQFDETVENFSASLSSTPYDDLVGEGFRNWSAERSLANYEKLSDNYLIDYIKPAKYIVFGVEPLIGYLLAKEHEMRLIRIVVIGKLNELSSEAIKERLRDTYV
jgi:V/A-type H+-transporting ATPase subunit C